MPDSVGQDYTDDLRLAHVLADDADSLTEARFKALDLHVMSKPDLTPVTDADEAVEESIRRTLSRVRSRDAVTGEEQGSTGHSQRRWIIDPIDGTKNFVRGVPVWATLIALVVDDEVVLGVVSAPLLQRRWWASTGNGAWTGRSLLKATQCHVSDVRRLEDASLSYSSLHGWDERGRLDDFVSLMRRCWRTRAYGDFWSYMLLAEGAVDIAAEPELAGLRHGGAGRDRARGRRHVHLARRHRRPVRRQRAGHQRPPARGGAVVPRLGGRRTTTTRTGSRPGPGSVSDLRPRGRAGRPTTTSTERSRVLTSPVQRAVGSLPSRSTPFREVAMRIGDVLNAKPSRRRRHHHPGRRRTRAARQARPSTTSAR